MAEYRWRDDGALESHFRRYGRDVGARTREQFHALAIQTIDVGVKFAFLRTDVPRIGYYDVRSRRLVVMHNNGVTILSLSRKNERHVRTLLGSTYGR